ncbi:MAG: hypothetical protein AKCLJLPJ_01692 [Fimbriimonadales bacterium]|nr:hypothetical protein [Fimbriimonadales bacterium]
MEDLLGTEFSIYLVPAWALRRVPRADSLIVFSDETGWLGHGSAKYVKDRSQYILEDAIRALAPIAPGWAVSAELKWMPARRLIVANMYDERKMTGREQFQQGVYGAMREHRKHHGRSIIVVDPVDDWNYFEQRILPEEGARIVMESLSKYIGKQKAIRVVVSKLDHAEAYASILNEYSENRWKFARARRKGRQPASAA